MAVSTNTVTFKEYSNGVKLITVNFVAAAADTDLTPEVILGQDGKKLHSIIITGGATGPTVNCDLGITDSVSGANLVATNGANAVDSDASVNYIIPDTAYTPAVIVGNLSIDPDISSENIVNNAETTVILVLQGKCFD